MRWVLIVENGPHKGKIIPINRSPFLIGRSPECRLRLSSGAVSRRHCLLHIFGDHMLVRDLCSTHGTFVNGQEVREDLEFHETDRLRIGRLVFLVHRAEPSRLSVEELDEEASSDMSRIID